PTCVEVVIRRDAADAGPPSILHFRDTSIYPLVGLYSLLVRQCFRVTLIHPGGFRPRNPFCLTLANNRAFKLRHTTEQPEHELGNRSRRSEERRVGKEERSRSRRERESSRDEQKQGGGSSRCSRDKST